MEAVSSCPDVSVQVIQLQAENISLRRQVFVAAGSFGFFIINVQLFKVKESYSDHQDFINSIIHYVYPNRLTRLFCLKIGLIFSVNE